MNNNETNPLRDIAQQFDIVDNVELKRYEFNSKNNKSCSYTVSYNEVDNVDDATISVWKAISLQSQSLPAEQPEKSLQDDLQRGALKQGSLQPSQPEGKTLELLQSLLDKEMALNQETTNFSVKESTANKMYCLRTVMDMVK